MMTGKLMMRQLQLQRGEHCHQARQLESDKKAAEREREIEREWVSRQEGGKER